VIDFAFIDADKTGYPTYYVELLSRLRPGGLLVLDSGCRAGGCWSSGRTIRRSPRSSA
jgi:caffeoyl-CoA O-methyltransferase